MNRVLCPECANTGLRDSGGVYPWGEGILVNCDCDVLVSDDRRQGYLDGFAAAMTQVRSMTFSDDVNVRVLGLVNFCLAQTYNTLREVKNVGPTA